MPSSPSLIRLPEGPAVLSAIGRRICSARGLGLTYAGGVANEEEARRMLLSRAILTGALARSLRQQWGPTDGQVRGIQDKKGLTFFFRMDDHAIMALAEPLPRGVTWWWITDTDRDWPEYPYALNDPAVASFWPRAVDALLERWLKAPENRTTARRLEASMPAHVTAMLDTAHRFPGALL